MKHLRSKITTLVGLLLIALIALPANATLAQDGGDDGDELPVMIEITGEVQIIEDDLIVVDGFEIAPAQGFRVSSLSLGDIVTVTGNLLNDDTIQADSIEIVTPVEDRDDYTPPTPSTTDDEDSDDDKGNGKGKGNNGKNNDDDDDADNGKGRGNSGNNGNNGNGKGNSGNSGNNSNNGKGNDDDKENEGEGCERDDHPFLLDLVEEFDVTMDTLVAWRCDKNGLGEIARALLIESETGISAQSILDRRADGEGWGAILQDLDINPSEFAPGRSLSHGKGRENAPGQQNREDRPGNGNSK